MNRSETLPAIDGVIFDWAGTIIDFGCQAPVRVFQAIFERRGVPISTKQAREPMGMAKRDHIAAIARMADVTFRWEASFGRSPTEEDIDGMYAEFLPLQKQLLKEHADPIPGAVALLERLRHQGIRIGTTTGYTRELMDELLPLAIEQGLDPDTTVTSDELSQGRPAPDGIREVQRRLELPRPERIVKVDDTAVGIEAASRAGCWGVGVVCSGNAMGLTADAYRALSDSARQAAVEQHRAPFAAAGAAYVIPTIAELEPVLEAINARIEAGETP